MKIVVVTTAHNCPLAVIRHDERQRRRSDLPGVDRDPILDRHVQKHAAEPVIGDIGEHVRRNSELPAAEGSGDRVAAGRDSVGRRHILFVAVGTRSVRKVTIGLADEECLHSVRPFALAPAAAAPLRGDQMLGPGRLEGCRHADFDTIGCRSPSGLTSVAAPRVGIISRPPTGPTFRPPMTGSRRAIQ
jgi:hypothetical protein